MSVRLMAIAWTLELPADEKLVLLALADHAQDNGEGAYPSVGLLARKTSLTRRGVQKLLRRLEQRGLICAPGGISKGGAGRTTKYALRLPNSVPQSPLNSEPYSPLTANSVRPSSTGTANQRAQNSEPGSPESSLTIKPFLSEAVASDKELVPTTPQSKPPCGKSIKPSETGIELAALLHRLILSNNPNARITAAHVERWAIDADLMMRRDNRTPGDVREMIEFCQGDTFWRSNVLSMSKLREQFDRLWVKRKGGAKPAQIAHIKRRNELTAEGRDIYKKLGVTLDEN